MWNPRHGHAVFQNSLSTVQRHTRQENHRTGQMNPPTIELRMIAASITMLHEKSIAAPPIRRGGTPRRTNLIGGSVTTNTASAITSRNPWGLQRRANVRARSRMNLAHIMTMKIVRAAVTTRAMMETGETVVTLTVYCCAKNDASTSDSASAWSPLMATCAGDSRKTLLVTRSILP
jgi:hypothetical protein